MYKLLTSARGCDDLFIGFHLNCTRRQQELSNNKNQKGKYHVSVFLKHIFGYSHDQLKATFGLGIKLTLTRNNDNAVLNKDNATILYKIKIIAIEWYLTTNSVFHNKLYYLSKF